MKILFQGDSLTDSGRNREIAEPNKELGTGYVDMIAKDLIEKIPDIEVYNRGIYGNRITDIFARWKPDTLNMQYDILSLMAGVNDIGFERRLNTGNDVEKYEFVYDRMLYEVKKTNPDAKIILMAPVIFKMRHYDSIGGYDVYEDWDLWSADIEAEGEVVKKLAEKYNAVFIPTFDVFKEKCKVTPAETYSADCIHLTKEGNSVLKDLWLKAAYDNNFI